MSLASARRQICRLSRLQASLETTAKARTALSRPPEPLTTWAARYLSHYFTAPGCAFHVKLAGLLAGLRTARGRRLCVLAPRGSAKSTWATLAYPLWSVVHRLEPFVVITADTTDQAEGYLWAVRHELESNPLLLRDYPLATGRGPVWSRGALRCANGCALKALGTGAKVRGRRERQDRPSLIVVDDPQNKDHVLSPLQRQRSWEWLTRDVCNAGGPLTNVVVLGTALHRDGIVCRLQQTPGWTCHLFRSVVQWPQRVDLWCEWELIYSDWLDPDREAKARAFYLAHQALMNE